MITILDIAKKMGAKVEDDGSLSLMEFQRLDLPLFPRCEVCQVALAPHESYPTTSGYINCKEHAEETGFASVEAAILFMKAEMKDKPFVDADEDDWSFPVQESYDERIQRWMKTLESTAELLQELGQKNQDLHRFLDTAYRMIHDSGITKHPDNPEPCLVPWCEGVRNILEKEGG